MFWGESLVSRVGSFIQRCGAMTIFLGLVFSHALHQLKELLATCCVGTYSPAAYPGNFVSAVVCDIGRWVSESNIVLTHSWSSEKRRNED